MRDLATLPRTREERSEHRGRDGAQREMDGMTAFGGVGGVSLSTVFTGELIFDSGHEGGCDRSLAFRKPLFSLNRTRTLPGGTVWHDDYRRRRRTQGVLPYRPHDHHADRQRSVLGCDALSG